MPLLNDEFLIYHSVKIEQLHPTLYSVLTTLSAISARSGWGRGINGVGQVFMSERASYGKKLSSLPPSRVSTRNCACSGGSTGLLCSLSQDLAKVTLVLRMGEGRVNEDGLE